MTALFAVSDRTQTYRQMDIFDLIGQLPKIAQVGVLDLDGRILRWRLGRVIARISPNDPRCIMVGKRLAEIGATKRVKRTPSYYGWSWADSVIITVSYTICCIGVRKLRLEIVYLYTRSECDLSYTNMKFSYLMRSISYYFTELLLTKAARKEQLNVAQENKTCGYALKKSAHYQAKSAIYECDFKINPDRLIEQRSTAQLQV